jgi:hypothetical protein
MSSFWSDFIVNQKVKRDALSVGVALSLYLSELLFAPFALRPVLSRDYFDNGPRNSQ